MATIRSCTVVHSAPFRLLCPFRRRRSVRIAPTAHRSCKISSAAFRRTMASASKDGGADAKRPFAVLFVCLGNICRSPSAEAVFRHVVDKRGLAAKFFIDSAGTIDYHEGDPADPRMTAAAAKRGIVLTSISRPINPSDFDKFDLILAMDKKNKADLIKAYNIWNANQPYSTNGIDKVKLMCSYCRSNTEAEVPDPYYGGPAGFQKVLDLLEDACEGLLDVILESSTLGAA